MFLDYNVLNKIEYSIGDSWYFLDIEKFIANYEALNNSFNTIYPLTKVGYSYKTNYIPLLCKTINDLGGFAEVVSEMEYSLAIELGIDPSMIIVNGPYKPLHALESYLSKGSIVNLDSYKEVSMVKAIAESNLESVFSVGIRCNFELESYEASRFGIDVNNQEFIEMIKDIAGIENIEIVSIHCHFPYREVDSFVGRVEKMLSLYDEVSKYCNLKYINIGGGLGGEISDELRRHIHISPVSYSDYASVIAERFKINFYNEANKPFLLLEPGTALVANVMSFVCKVIDIKKIGGAYIAVTSGSKVNYHSRTSNINLPIQIYSSLLNNREFYESINIAGYTCMEDDFIYKGYSGNIGIGDYVAVDNVGSYSIVFKPPFINPNVPIITYIKGEIDIIKEKESYDYIFKTYKKDW